MNRKFNLIILAGGEQGPLSDATEYSSKAMIDINGRPMIDRVIEAYQQTDYFENIVVVGPDELDGCAMADTIRKRIPSSGSLVQNLAMGVGYIKSRSHDITEDHNGYVVSFCDAAFLTPELINHTMRNIVAADADIVLHYVEKSSFEAANLHAKRTYIEIDGRYYSGTVIYYIRRFSKVITQLGKLAELRVVRKDPLKILEVIGAKDNTLPAIEEALSHYINVKVRIYISPHPGLAMDVDKPGDLELARQFAGGMVS